MKSFHRNIPFEMFLALKTSVQHSRKSELTDNVAYSDNRKQQVMTFSSKKAVIVLLPVLSGYSEANVKGFFKRNLVGRKHGKARVIVSCGHEFSFTYKIKSGQFVFLSTMEYGTRQVLLSTTSDGKLKKLESICFNLVRATALSST